MATSLSKLVDNLTDNIHNDKCIKCKSNLCFVRAMNETLFFKSIDCEKEYEKEINKELIERCLQIPINFVIMISINLLCY